MDSFPAPSVQRPTTRGRTSRRGGAAGGQDVAETGGRARSSSELVPDPEWHDLECPPSVEEYAWFNMPRSFGSGMMADRARWAPDVPVPIACAVVRAVAGVVVPRIMDFEQWRRHTVDFFKRLCAHRRAMHTRWNRAMRDFSTRQGTLAERILALEQRIEVLEAQLAAAQMESHPPQRPVSRGQPRREHSLPERSLGATPVGSGRRELSVPERILEAQLGAIGKRSDSPGPDALRALEAFRQMHGPPFPPMSAVAPGVPIPPQPDTQVSRGRAP